MRDAGLRDAKGPQGPVCKVLLGRVRVPRIKGLRGETRGASDAVSLGAVPAKGAGSGGACP